MEKTTLGPTVLNICHRRPDRSFFYRGKQFPVCARCTGTLLGFALLPFFALKVFTLTLLWSLLLHLPTLADGGTQALGWRESNNWLRLATGTLLGIGQMGLVAICGDFIVDKLGILQLFQ